VCVCVCVCGGGGGWKETRNMHTSLSASSGLSPLLILRNENTSTVTRNVSYLTITQGHLLKLGSGFCVLNILPPTITDPVSPF